MFIPDLYEIIVTKVDTNDHQATCPSSGETNKIIQGKDVENRFNQYQIMDNGEGYNLNEICIVMEHLE